MPETTADSVFRSIEGRVGHVRLNRPEALNALDFRMISAIEQALSAWKDARDVDAVLIDGAGDRAFCAGGDIRASQDPDSSFTSEEFLRVEYAVNLMIAEYPKPVVAIMHGIVLGGGMGLTAHASHRIVTESSRLGMPEVGIGFIPDVGMTRLLSGLAGEAGTYLALTGGVVGAGDAIEVGLADHFIPGADLAAFERALRDQDPDTAIARFAAEAPPTSIADDRAWIATDFAADRVQDILDRLAARTEPRALEAAATIATRSPTALVLALRALREAGEDPSLAHSLDREFRVAVRAFASDELAEGVRAQLIDRDRRPRWRPATLAEVGSDIIEPYFAPLPDELGLGQR